MNKRTMVVGLPGLLAAALLATGCSDALGPEQRSLGTPLFAVVSSGIALDQQNGALRQSNTSVLLKGFNPVNPHLGDAIIATFYWFGSSNIITRVHDHLANSAQTPAGNTYTLVEYVTAGGLSMATYVATNVQNFPDPNPTQDEVLVVQADLSEPVTDGGVKISAWSGVGAVFTQALGAHSSASGSGSSTTIAAPGTIAVGAGALAYAVTMANAVVSTGPPDGFTQIGEGSDDFIKEDGQYLVSAGVSSVNPQWIWFFDSPSTWLATVLSLEPPLHLAFTVQPSTTLPLVTMQPAVQVTALNALGNPVTSFNGLVTVAIGRNGGLLLPGTLSGTKTRAAVNGVATFSDLSIDQAGNGYTLVANASGLTGVESAPFNIGLF